MAKHDSGDWHLDAAKPEPMTIDQRANTLLKVCSPEQRAAMRKEEEFLRTVKPFTTKRFTDRRPPVGRDRLIP
jgi:hypothetical protein